MHFQDQFYTLFNSVQSLDVNLSLTRDTIICREKCQCRADVANSHLHCHIITKAEVKKIDEDGILFIVLICYNYIYLIQ